MNLQFNTDVSHDPMDLDEHSSSTMDSTKDTTYNDGDQSITRSDSSSSDQSLRDPVAFLPHCHGEHGTLKGKGREGEPPTGSPLVEYPCDDSVRCQTGALKYQNTPPTLKTYRAVTSDHAHDLRRWLTTPNCRLGDGFQGARTTLYAGNPRFTDADLRDAAHFGGETISNDREHLTSLIEYANREPYNLEICYSLTTRQDYSLTTRQDTPIQEKSPSLLDRGDLEQLLRLQGTELDFLRSLAQYVTSRIVAAKSNRAQNYDNRAEILHLRDLG